MDSDVALFVDYFVTRRKDGTYILTKKPEEMEEALKKLLRKHKKEYALQILESLERI